MKMLFVKKVRWSGITLEQVNLRPIIGHTGTYIYKTSKFVTKIFGPVAKNDYTIRYALSFPDLLKSDPSDHKYEKLLYEVKNLFTIMPFQETIDYFLYKTCVKKLS